MAGVGTGAGAAGQVPEYIEMVTRCRFELIVMLLLIGEFVDKSGGAGRYSINTINLTRRLTA
jgi:hypothetical protein